MWQTRTKQENFSNEILKDSDFFCYATKKFLVSDKQMWKKIMRFIYQRWYFRFCPILKKGQRFRLQNKNKSNFGDLLKISYMYLFKDG